MDTFNAAEYYSQLQDEAEDILHSTKVYEKSILKKENENLKNEIQTMKLSKQADTMRSAQALSDMYAKHRKDRADFVADLTKLKNSVNSNDTAAMTMIDDLIRKYATWPVFVPS